MPFSIIPYESKRRNKKREKKYTFRIYPHPDGYYHIKLPNGVKSLHRHLFEQYYKCCLLPWSVIHHKDRNRKNNAIWNLQLTDKWKHRGFHKKIPN